MRSINRIVKNVLNENEYNQWAVDLPNPHDIEGAWVTVDYFDSESEAIKFVAEYFGGDVDGNIGVVSFIEG